MASNRSTEVELTAPGSPTDIELLQRNHHQPPNSDAAFSLPPTDGGKDAWLCLIACFMLEAMIWGFPSCYGIFQEYYATSNEFSGQGNIAVVGACAMVCSSAPLETPKPDVHHRVSCTWTSRCGSLFSSTSPNSGGGQPPLDW